MSVPVFYASVLDIIYTRVLSKFLFISVDAVQFVSAGEVISMKQRSLIITVAMTSAILMWTSGASLAADYKSAILANPCAGCHGTDGASPGPIPPINSMPGSYISSAMKDYKSGKRKGTVMNRIARGYTDEEIDLMAKHFDATK